MTGQHTTPITLERSTDEAEREALLESLQASLTRFCPRLDSTRCSICRSFIGFMIWRLTRSRAVVTDAR